MEALKQRLLAAVAVAAFVALAIAAVRAELFDPENVQEFVLQFGAIAPLVYVLLYMVAVFVPYATTVMTMAAGLAFGTVWGTLLTFSVTLFASLLPMTLARRLGRAWVERRIGATRVEKYADKINENAFLVFFYLRLVPSLPYELQNYIAGITRITYKQFVLASFLGTWPVVIILAFFGDSLTNPGSPRFWLAAGLYLSALLAPVVYLLIRRRWWKEERSRGGAGGQ
jgi:uncharacterized membrane protein YdjX (TVP38/TMEM64 family)